MHKLLKFLKFDTKKFGFDKKVSSFFVGYFMIGLIFAFVYAINYKWGPLSFFSPGFYIVMLTWPFNLPGLVSDILYWGFRGKLG